MLMNGVKRGLFSNEAGSGSAPCAAAAAECDSPVKAGLVQALGVFVDTIVICSCTAMIMLLAPEEMVAGLAGMDLLQTAMDYHLGQIWSDLYCGDAYLCSVFRHSWESSFMQEAMWHIFSVTTGLADCIQSIGTCDAVYWRNCSLYICMGSGRCGNRSDDDLQHCSVVPDGRSGTR